VLGIREVIVRGLLHNSPESRCHNYDGSLVVILCKPRNFPRLSPRTIETLDTPLLTVDFRARISSPEALCR